MDAATAAWYVAPLVGIHALTLLVETFAMKFATDTLAIGPGAIGLIFSISRLWDAFVDPAVGYLSDRTHSSLGRRRSWLLGGALPIACSFVAIFAPPEALRSGGLIGWEGVAIVAFASFSSTFHVPHLSLGAELTAGLPPAERTRLFGWRHVVKIVGQLAGIALLFPLLSAQADDAASAASRAAIAQPPLPPTAARIAALLSVGVAGASALLTLFSVGCLTETSAVSAVSAAPATVRGAVADVLRNRHNVVLSVALFVEESGKAVFSLLAPYAIQYVALLKPELSSAVMLAFLAASLASVPVWLAVSARVGKKRAWLVGMGSSAVAYLGSLPYLHPSFFPRSSEVRFAYLVLVAVALGFCSASGSVVGTSLQADVVSWDEATTGERKEGVYFAWWNFLTKTGSGVVTMLSGLLLEAAHFVPNVEQTFGAKLAITSLVALLPAAGLVAGTLVFATFDLDEVQTRLRLARSADTGLARDKTCSASRQLRVARGADESSGESTYGDSNSTLLL